MKLSFSLVIPVYNRPNEVQDLLESIVNQNFTDNFEVLVIEDGSTLKCDKMIADFQSKLNIQYYFKENSGAGSSRNFGMQKASGNYFIILDSDVILPKTYLTEVKSVLETQFTDAFGGPDKAHNNFTNLQKAINYSMTSLLTTGGIRGQKKAIGKFQPRSFNFGLSKKAFRITKGFSDLKYGEDIDLTFRLWQHDFETQLIPTAFVYHKRRSSLKEFYKQTYHFGTARPKLNKRFPETAKITYWFPSLFVIGLLLSFLLPVFGYSFLIQLYVIYFLALFFDSFLHNGIQVAVLSCVTSLTQFLGYGFGFLSSYLSKN